MSKRVSFVIFTAALVIVSAVALVRGISAFRLIKRCTESVSAEFIGYDIVKHTNTSKSSYKNYYPKFRYEYGGKLRRTPILICKGSCDRAFRPLACRIFPLTPVLDKDDRIKIITDPRAKRLCPLTDALAPDEYEPDFIRAVQRAFDLLRHNKQVLAFLREYTDYINDFNKFFG